MTNYTKNNYSADAIVSAALKTNIGIILVACAALVTVYSGDLSYFVPPSVDLLSIVSGVYFCVLLLFSLQKESSYWSVLPLVVLSVPNAVNDLLPSVLMAHPVDGNTPAFSLITHIDIFLLTGIIRHGRFRLTTNFIISSLVMSIIGLITFFLLIANVWGLDWIYGLFQIRYLVFVWILFLTCNPFEHVNGFVNGFVLSAFVIISETIVYSYENSSVSHLLSGNFGKNPLGHLSAAAFCFYYFYKPNGMRLFACVISMAVFAVLLIGSGTRFSLFALIFVLALIHLLKSDNVARKALYGLSFVLVVLLFLLVAEKAQSAIDGVVLVIEGGFDPELIERSAESSSMITRLHVWAGTLPMIYNNPILGVGPGGWGFMKDDYGIPFAGLLDPHNDMLSFMASYGIIFGILAYFFIMIFPLIYSRKFAFKHGNSFLLGAYGFVFVVLITGLTNAALWKHQIFAITCVFSFFLLHSRRVNWREV